MPVTTRASAFSYEVLASGIHAQPEVQIRMSRVRQVIAEEAIARQKVIYKTKALFQTLSLRLAMATARFSSTTGDG